MIFAVFPCTHRTALFWLLTFTVFSWTAQSQTGGSVPPSAAAEHAVKLAEAGHCAEAIPELRKTIKSLTNSDLKKLAGLHGLRCSMIRNSPIDAEDFLQFLR